MNAQEMFHAIMTKEDTMALATSVDNRPNVRVVNFGYNPDDKNKVYLTTFPGNHKIEEFEQNDEVACCILPHLYDIQGQVRLHGKVRKSLTALADVKMCLSKNAPDYGELLNQAGNVLILFEIEFTEASVTINMDDAEVISI